MYARACSMLGNIRHNRHRKHQNCFSFSLPVEPRPMKHAACSLIRLADSRCRLQFSLVSPNPAEVKHLTRTWRGFVVTTFPYDGSNSSRTHEIMLTGQESGKKFSPIHDPMAHMKPDKLPSQRCRDSNKPQLVAYQAFEVASTAAERHQTLLNYRIKSMLPRTLSCLGSGVWTAPTRPPFSLITQCHSLLLNNASSTGGLLSPSACIVFDSSKLQQNRRCRCTLSLLWSAACCAVSCS